MTQRTTLLPLAVAALLGLGGLAMLNNVAAQNLQPAGEVPQIQIAPPPIVGTTPVPPASTQPPFGQFQVPPNGIAVPPNGKFNGPIPNAGAPVEYKTKEGKKGWKVVIPGNRPLATPAVVDGKVLIGGGFGSYEFYCLDAKSGKQHWVYRTGDDGPTAAVVSDGYIAFNTESCEIEIITMEGKKVWKKWLGDPLMSMPAIADGKVYQSYPAGKGNGDHHVACFDLKSGKQFWTKAIPGQVVTAPIISKGKLYLTTLEGSMTCMEARDGTVVWQEKKNATSAPVVLNGEVFFSRRDQVKIKDKEGKEINQQMEAIALKGEGKDSPVRNVPATEQPADYLDLAKRIQYSPAQAGYSKADASVGFPTAPPAAGLLGAGMNLGQNTVNGIWAYQGSKPFIYNNRLYTAMGDTVKCVDPKTQKLHWQKDLKNVDNKKPVVDATLTPPAIVNGKMFMGTSAGQIVCMSAETGKTLWTATVEGPISFQPAVANGMVYVATNNGTLFAIETGDPRDHGWLMWGANAAHNGGID